MVCIYCSGNTQVINSRLQKRSNGIWRRRKCLKSNCVFSTTESINYDSALRVRTTDGKLNSFEPSLLFVSLYESLKHRDNPAKDAKELTNTIIGMLAKPSKAIIDKQEIYNQVLSTLENFDKVATAHYSAFHKQNR